MKNVRIGLVTVLYNSNDVLPGFIESLSKQTYTNYHLYIIDNSPSVATDLLLSDLFVKYPMVKYTHLKSDTNLGVAKGNNIGIESARLAGADYILLLNNDIEFYQIDLLEKMVDMAVEREEKLLIPKILYYQSRTIWMAGGYFQTLLARTPHIGDKMEDSPEYNVAKYVHYAPTCFMLVSKEVFDVIGVMDEKYFVYYDDSDFILRARKKGFMIYYVPSFEVFHKVSNSTGGQLSPFSVYYTNRNRLYYVRKHYGLVHLSYIYILLSCIYSYLFRYDVQGKKALIKAISDWRKL